MLPPFFDHSASFDRSAIKKRLKRIIQTDLGQYKVGLCLKVVPNSRLKIVGDEFLTSIDHWNDVFHVNLLFAIFIDWFAHIWVMIVKRGYLFSCQGILWYYCLVRPYNIMFGDFLPCQKWANQMHIQVTIKKLAAGARNFVSIISFISRCIHSTVIVFDPFYLVFIYCAILLSPKMDPVNWGSWVLHLYIIAYFFSLLLDHPTA